ncbi:tyrosine-protein kinase family protein [Mucilaginibacter sp. L196]|uniref:GumC family protein n=1 Tax=Mucilaginibacter sp. L196 TaxID=1641870 RepID=UPI00131CC1D8|nr:tyrosine-protein kinase family protein [Mucilaginibacter sp. L196]
MCAQLSDFSSTPYAPLNPKDDFRKVVSRYLYHWPLYIAFFAISLVCLFFYSKFTAPVYTIKASIIIKDEVKEPGFKSQLEQLEVYNTPNLAEDELEKLKSRTLMTQVVKDLHLQVSYFVKDNFKTLELYNNSPVNFHMYNLPGDDTTGILRIKIKNRKVFQIEEPSGQAKEFLFGQNLTSLKLGTYTISPAAGYDNFSKKQITIVVNSYNNTVDGYQDALVAELPNKLVPVIELSIKDQIPERGKTILNHLIELYNQNNLDEKNQLTEKALNFINSRIASFSGTLTSSEIAVQNYRKSEGIADMSSQSKIYLENEQSNDSKLNDVNVQLSIINGISKYLVSSQNIQMVSASLGPNYPALNDLIEKLSQLDLQREKMLANTPEGNPAFDPINRAIQSLKVEIANNIQSIKQSLLLTKSKLHDNSSNFESSIKNVPQQERELISKTREQSIREDLYTYLVQKREEIGLNYAAILPDARIVDYAYAGAPKSSRMMFGIILILIGVVLPTGIIYGRITWTNRVIDLDQVERELEIEILGEISKTYLTPSLVNFNDGCFGITEELRDLRTNLNSKRTHINKGSVIMVTSSIANEGKSFISSNLGCTFAVSGKKVIVLEMDFRKPQISKVFGMSERSPGLTDYLKGKSSIEDIIQVSEHDNNLHVISSGMFVNNPSELLQSASMDILFTFLLKNYDDIIVDTPPVNLVTDAKLIARFADITLYVVRQAYTYKTLLPFIKSLYKKNLFSNMHIVFNGVDRKQYGYDYSDNYYSRVKRGNNLMLKTNMMQFFSRF